MKKTEKTLAIIKPNSVKAGYAMMILDMIALDYFKVVGIKMIQLTDADARKFYAIHSGRPNFDELIKFIISSPVVVAVLEKEDAVKSFMELIGATDPAEAADGTIRRKFGESITENSIHGSDSPENARIEIGFFFSGLEIFSINRN
jgi:nucleoside-diphosphate kinase